MRWNPPAVTTAEVEEHRKRYHERVDLYRAHGYDREQAMRFVVDAAEPIRPPVLDIGGGKGFTAMEIASRGHRVTTVDLSEEELRVAHLNATVRGLDGRIEYYLDDANGLPFADGAFTLVTMVNLLHHVERVDGILPEIARVLVPGGMLLAADFTEDGFRILDRIHEEEGRVHERVGRSGIDEVAEMLPAFGLECRGRDTRFHQYAMIAVKL